MILKKGDTFKILRGIRNPYKAHVLAVIDSVMIVFKWYGRHKQWWHYEIKHISIIETEIEIAEKRIANQKLKQTETSVSVESE